MTRGPRQRLELTDEDWRSAELISVVALGARARAMRQAFAALTGCATALVLIVALGRDQQRCGQNCYGSAPLSHYGSMTYEPGHHWTQYAGSWQWSAQLALAWAAVAGCLLGLALVLLSRTRLWPFSLATAFVIGWTTWVVLEPSSG
jgi:hypothetical protein